MSTRRKLMENYVNGNSTLIIFQFAHTPMPPPPPPSHLIHFSKICVGGNIRFQNLNLIRKIKSPRNTNTKIQLNHGIFSHKYMTYYLLHPGKAKKKIFWLHQGKKLRCTAKLFVNKLKYFSENNISNRIVNLSGNKVDIYHCWIHYLSYFSLYITHTHTRARTFAHACASP